ncbi:MAG: nickel-binding protein [Marmoricola sp.]
MTLYMDVHTMNSEIGINDVARAHQADLKIQGDHGVNYLSYWVDEKKRQDLLPRRRP